MNSPVVPFLNMRLPDYVTVDDPSLEVLNLLRIVHALNRYWGFLYQLVDYKPILSNHELVNSKLTAKANRQLQVNICLFTFDQILCSFEESALLALVGLHQF